MLNNSDWLLISEQISQATNQPFNITKKSPVSGGCINSAYILESKNSHFFIKLNHRELLPMFKAEFAGLNEIDQSNTITVPKPIVTGLLSNIAFIVLEGITFASGTIHSDEQLGHQLAALHKTQQAYFGWHQNNTIGSTTQINDKSDNWIRFWQDKRLNYQLSLAAKNGYSKKLILSGEILMDSVAHFFINYQPHPSLLHGDLWGGNAAVTERGAPIIYDPACYYGDRETDIAMTELFGGFGSRFYSAYNEAYPLNRDYNIRKTLYNLYHILNHLNLFGSGYQQQAQNMIDSLLSEIH